MCVKSPVVSHDHLQHKACVRRHCRPSSGQLQSPSLESHSTHQVSGVVSPKRLTGSELKDFYITASAMVTVRLTFPHWLNNVPPLMKNSLKKICLNNNHVLRVHEHGLFPLPHRTTAFDLERTACNYRNIVAF